MKLHLLALSLVLFLVAACGGGDKPAPSTDRGSNEPTAEGRATEADADSGTPESAVTQETGDDGDGGAGDAIGELFTSVFSSSFQGGNIELAGTGDEALKEYLPSSDDLPEGYTEFGVFAFSVPGTLGGGGTMDMAAQMAVKGDIMSGEMSEVEMLMSMVIHPDDLQALGEAFDEIRNLDPDEVEDEIGSSLGTEAFGITNFEVLTVDDLGDGGFGMEMTMDLAQLGALFGGLGGEETGAGFPSSMSMRMYVFGRGDYIGATMHLAFADSLGDADELDLARLIDGNLADAR